MGFRCTVVSTRSGSGTTRGLGRVRANGFGTVGGRFPPVVCAAGAPPALGVYSLRATALADVLPRSEVEVASKPPSLTRPPAAMLPGSLAVPALSAPNAACSVRFMNLRSAGSCFRRPPMMRPSMKDLSTTLDHGSTHHRSSISGFSRNVSNVCVRASYVDYRIASRRRWPKSSARNMTQNAMSTRLS